MIVCYEYGYVILIEVICFSDIATSVSFQKKALEAAMNDINSSFGKGSVTRLGSAGGALVYELFVFLIYHSPDWWGFSGSFKCDRFTMVVGWLELFIENYVWRICISYSIIMQVQCCRLSCQVLMCYLLSIQGNFPKWLFDVRLCLRWWPSERKNCWGMFTRSGSWHRRKLSICFVRKVLSIKGQPSW